MKPVKVPATQLPAPAGPDTIVGVVDVVAMAAQPVADGQVRPDREVVAGSGSATQVSPEVVMVPARTTPAPALVVPMATHWDDDGQATWVRVAPAVTHPQPGEGVGPQGRAGSGGRAEDHRSARPVAHADAGRGLRAGHRGDPGDRGSSGDRGGPTRSCPVTMPLGVAVGVLTGGDAGDLAGSRAGDPVLDRGRRRVGEVDRAALVVARGSWPGAMACSRVTDAHADRDGGNGALGEAGRWGPHVVGVGAGDADVPPAALATNGGLPYVDPAGCPRRGWPTLTV